MPLTMDGESKVHRRKTSQPPVPEKHGYEFMGPPGALLITLGLPFVVYSMAFLCNDISGCPAPSLLHPSSFTFQKLKEETGWPGFAGLFDAKVTGWVLAYYGLSLALQVFLPGEEVEGTELRCGGRLKYKFNSFYSAIIICSGAILGTAIYGPEFPLWPFIYQNVIQIITANLLISLFLAFYVYISSFSVPPQHSPNPGKRLLALGGHSGNILYDWFIGRELNPRVTLPIPFVSETARTIDIKIFMEIRPGMLGWILVNLSSLAHQYNVHGKQGPLYLSDSIILITAFQTLYVLDALYMEPSILTTIDITTDGFGFMLAFGDLVWLPLTYSIQTRYLAIDPVHLGPLGILLVFAVQALGFYIFRSANNEKNRFRTDPSDPRISHLKFIPTRTGSRLLVSGWWGVARHINYFGDWIMSWSYTLPTGFAGYQIITNQLTSAKEVVPGEARGWGTIFTYFYVLYFAILLIHRERRDEEKCRKKYGADWEEYVRRVPSRIVPGIY